MTQRSISILGATGSIGASTLDLVRRRREEWRVVALTANRRLGVDVLQPHGRQRLGGRLAEPRAVHDPEPARER